MELRNDKCRTVCFSGYRPEKFPFSLDNGNEDYLNLCGNISGALIEVLEQGYDTFLCGMSRGFDLVCAKILTELRRQNKKHRDVKLVAVLPFEGHKFSGYWGVLHKAIKAATNQVIIASPEYTHLSYQLRNRLMIENSSCLICYWDGQEGGTAQTVRMAVKLELTIRNLAEK